MARFVQTGDNQDLINLDLVTDISTGDLTSDQPGGDPVPNSCTVRFVDGHSRAVTGRANIEYILNFARMSQPTQPLEVLNLNELSRSIGNLDRTLRR